MIFLLSNWQWARSVALLTIMVHIKWKFNMVCHQLHIVIYYHFLQFEITVSINKPWSAVQFLFHHINTTKNLSYEQFNISGRDSESLIQTALDSSHQQHFLEP